MSKKTVKLLARVPLMLVLAVGVFISIFPFYWMTVMGTVTQDKIFSQMPLLPGNALKENYESLIGGIPFFRAIFNSVYISFATTILTVFISALAGYAFGKFEFAGKKAAFSIVMATMMIPAQLGLVAFVWEMNLIGWSDTHWPLIIPSIASGFGVFWMRQYIQGTVYSELLESARIDGCKEFGVFIRIVLPVIKPAIFSLGILTFMGNWQNFLTPLVILNSIGKYTLPLAIAALKGVHRNNYSAQFLGLTLGTIPVIVVFLTGTKTFISGLTAGAVKG